MHLSARRSLLFAPTHRAEYFAKAAEKGADIGFAKDASSLSFIQ